MQSASPKKTAMTFLRGSKFVWSVREMILGHGGPSALVGVSSWTLPNTSGVTDWGVDGAVLEEVEEAMERDRGVRRGQEEQGPSRERRAA